MNEQDIKVMLKNFSQGKATDKELALLEAWYLTYHEEGTENPNMAERLAAVDMVWAKLDNEHRPVKRMAKWWSVAAAAILLLSVGSYFVWKAIQVPVITVSQLAGTKKDIAPGTNKATLTIGGSGTLVLDSARTGLEVHPNNLTYDDNTRINAALTDTKMLTLQTPKGGTYRLVLPDGSVVWLNAASHLSFPSSFKGKKQREVELSGEAYFEVAKNKAMPFIVKSRGQQVEVLGTHFNINSYDDEPLTRTTLLEGSVRIGATLLKPGEQAENNGTSIKTIPADLDEVMGWKNNYIVFQDEKIESIMRKISRWYDVEIAYEGTPPADDFGGRINKRAYMSQVLKKLELTNKVHFKIQGRRIVVTK
ncbi:FecR domain-containing protein [Mucilaginibacter rigui]|uniref:FecR domain-containing protein n=1 Tax=Mucilaginibacter rigui TaxID=534635 RepID=A0ABR7XAC5_9SPHI|nr:FecR domain-containing protein [Mucilaginibacter rigui]